MGRKMNLAHLTDTECRQILDVIQRDFRVRHDERERFTDLHKCVYEEAQKRTVLSRQQQFNEKHCICCFSSFGFILNRKIQCQVCQFFICKNCRAKSEPKEDITCIACVQQKDLQVRACEWFYAQIRAKFKRFGSAKVVRSLYKRNSRDKGSGSEEESQNSDSGVERQRSPLSQGAEFDLCAFMQAGSMTDQETNTDPDWMKLLRPPMSSVAVQAPQDRTDSEYVTEDLIQPSIATGESCAKNNTCSCNQTRDASSSPSLVVYNPQGDEVVKDREQGSSSQSAPPVAAGRGGDAMLFHILSPIEEMSSPEQPGSKPGSPAPSATVGDLEGNVIQEDPCEGQSGDSDSKCPLRKGESAHQEDMKIKLSEEEEAEENVISPKEQDSGIHLGFSTSMDSDVTPCPDAVEADKMLSQRLQMQNIGCSDSFESVSSASLSLEANDTLDSLETHIHSSHSDLESPTPDIHDDFDSTNSTLTGKVEVPEDEWKATDGADPPAMSRSSSEDTLKSDDEEEVGEEGLLDRELSIEEFLDEIHTRTSSMTEEEGMKDDDEDGDEGLFKQNSLDDASDTVQEEEAENRDQVSLNLEFHPRSFYRRSRSSDDFRSMKNEDPSDDVGSNSDGEDSKVKGKQHRSRKTSSNRFIRYDSLPLVVEVYEADSNSPSFSPVEFSKSRFIYDSGQDSESPGDYKGLPRHENFPSHRMHEKSFYRKNGYPDSTGQSRQTSVESTTTESTLPKSTPISSGPTTPDSDRKRQMSSESECSPDSRRRDKVLFTRQLLHQHKEYHHSEGIRPSTDPQIRSLSFSASREDSPAGGSRKLQKQSSLPCHNGRSISEGLPAYRRLNASQDCPTASGFEEHIRSKTKDLQQEEDEEGDDIRGVCNTDEIVGLLSEQNSSDISDTDDRDDDTLEDTLEDALSALAEDINGNRRVGHGDVCMTDGQFETGNAIFDRDMEVDKELSRDGELKNDDDKQLEDHTPEHHKAASTRLSQHSSEEGERQRRYIDEHCTAEQSDSDGEEANEHASDGCSDGAGEEEEGRAEEERGGMSSSVLERKEEVDLLNLTHKLSIKQGEVLQSAEDVLSSANQMSNIQYEVNALDSILTSLERKLAKGVLSSQTSSECEDSEGPDFDVTPQEIVKEDLCDLEIHLSNTDNDNPGCQMNMASAVRMITATALKVLSTTEAAIELQQGEPPLHSPLQDDTVSDWDRDEMSNHGDLMTDDEIAACSDLQGERNIKSDGYVDEKDVIDWEGSEKDSNANATGTPVSLRQWESELEREHFTFANEFNSGGHQEGVSNAPTTEGLKENRDPEELEFLNDLIGAEEMEKDLRERKGVQKDSLKLKLPGQKQKGNQQPKKTKDGDSNAAPMGTIDKTSSIVPKSPEATISPGSHHSTSSPSSGPILHLTCGSTSPPTATLLFSSLDDLIWDPPSNQTPGSGSDSEGVLPTEMEPEEGKDPRNATRFESSVPLPSAAKDKSEVSIFESSSTSCGFKPDFMAAFYDHVSELEERVYLSAGKVFTLEERLQQLELEVSSVDGSQQDELMGLLEDKVALTVAQVHQCEREVDAVESKIAGLDPTQDGLFSTMYSVDHIPSTPRKLEAISSASFMLNHPAARPGPFSSVGLVQIEIPSGGSPLRPKRRRHSSASDESLAASLSPTLSPADPRDGATLTEMDGGVVVYSWGNLSVTDVSLS